MEREENNCTKYEEANDLMRAKLCKKKEFANCQQQLYCP